MDAKRQRLEYVKGMELAENIDQYKHWQLLEGEDSQVMVPPPDTKEDMEKSQTQPVTDQDGDEPEDLERKNSLATCQLCILCISQVEISRKSFCPRDEQCLLFTSLTT